MTRRLISLMLQPGCLDVGPDEKQGFFGLSSGFLGSINSSSSNTKVVSINQSFLRAHDKLFS